MASGIVVNRQAVEKLQSFYNDPAYRDAIENSASYNTRMMFEKKMRLPFLDAQTGVAQNHCNLWMLPRHRMPGEEPGQIYTYPAKRWRKRRRQYLTTFLQPRKKEGVDGEPETGVAEVFPIIREAGNEDSKDSMPVGAKDEASKETWYYDELDIQDAADFEEHDGDSDVDYEESFNKKKKKKAVAPKTPKSTRGRKKQIPVNYDASVDAEKPYSCETCGARYKTRPGLTYHYTHSHKNLLEDDDDEPAPVPSTPKNSRDQSAGSNSGMDTPVRSRSTRQAAQTAVVNSPSAPSPMAMQHTPPPPPPAVESHPMRRANVAPTPQQHHQQPPALVPQQPLPVPAHPVAAPSSSGMVVNQEMEEKARAMPSPYCDFCLGDASENKKTGCSEELVSCSDCGRSGHPSCLQFTPNMIISVKKYRWQCIECKCCSLCGNSDNDEQLLFCDDCDRGYHMYCLKPPLSEPPEGSWSCHLCQVVFHRK